MFQISVRRSIIAGLAFLGTGCGSDMMDADAATQLLSVSPQGGATAVATTTDIVLTFSGSMTAGMEQYLALHKGGLTGPTIQISCAWSNSHTTLTCHPGSPLELATRHTIHMGGGMMDASGQRIGMERHGMSMGGQWVTSDMMGGQTGMMGEGWRHANGSYGMAFEFTTQ